MKIRAKFWAAHVTAAKFETISANDAGHGIKFVSLSIAAQRPCLCTLQMPSGLPLEMSALPVPECLAALGRALPGAR